jgi:hypothetical protein
MHDLLHSFVTGDQSYYRCGFLAIQSRRAGSSRTAAAFRIRGLDAAAHRSGFTPVASSTAAKLIGAAGTLKAQATKRWNPGPKPREGAMKRTRGPGIGTVPATLLRRFRACILESFRFASRPKPCHASNYWDASARAQTVIVHVMHAQTE